MMTMMEPFKVIGLGLFFVLTGLVIGYLTGGPSPKPSSKVDVFQVLQEEIGYLLSNHSKAAGFLRDGVTIPPESESVTGENEDQVGAEWIRGKFIEFGLDEAQLFAHKVPLSYQVHLVGGTKDGQINYSTPELVRRQRPPLPLFRNPFDGITEAEGGLVYVNYGSGRDFRYVEEDRGIKVTGNIVMARYSSNVTHKIPWSDIAEEAEMRGAAGVILFQDPDGMAKASHGDPLAAAAQLFDPSSDGRPSRRFPRIPVQPIGYDSAEILLRALKEENEAPKDWQAGSPPDVGKYYLGPDLNPSGRKIRMTVKTITIYNAVGILRGREEPDRYVLLGSRRRDVSSGAPRSGTIPGGTAAMIEVARAFAHIRQNRNWRPRRSLVFCSWGGGEASRGSAEWAKEHSQLLSQRAVAYLNIQGVVPSIMTDDGITPGSDRTRNSSLIMRVLASPLLRPLLEESSRKIVVPNPLDPTNTWRIDPALASIPPDVDSKDYPHETSGLMPMMLQLGIPSLDIVYHYHEPPSHQEVVMIEAVMAARLWAETARNLAESLLLPLDVDAYASYLAEALAHFKLRYGDLMEANGVDLRPFEGATEDFVRAAGTFVNDTLRRLDPADVLAVRQVNDQLTQLERHFIDPYGLMPNRPEFNRSSSSAHQQEQHVVFPLNAKSSTRRAFPGLTDLLESQPSQDDSDSSSWVPKIKRHLSSITERLEGAAASLFPLSTSGRPD